MAKKPKSTMRRVRSLSPMAMMIPFIMPDRVGSQNFISDRIPIGRVEQDIKEKQAEGMTNISLMHVLIAAYVRMCADRPAINRFIRGQRVWTRDEVEISLTIKREMTLESPDTVVKIILPRDATLREVYDALNEKIVEADELLTHIRRGIFCIVILLTVVDDEADGLRNGGFGSTTN